MDLSLGAVPMVGGPPIESTTTDDLCMDIQHPPNKENVATAEDWRRALNKVIPAVVVLHITATRAFDTMLPATSQATGFVVDKRLGIILTNGHVVRPGPIVAEAIFMNREEIPVYPIYRDPVHDFGFFHYDPSTVQFLNYEEIPLAPEVACVGLEIKVVGNDSLGKVSILAGTLARLDRDAPCYKTDGYNDFNTFYIQAASGTRGGSSGSPVIDWQGRAVALNAGSKPSSALAFYLPLERVVRALRFLQKGRDTYANKWEAVSIPRGTLQATFLHKGFDETRRLGLQSETELMVRHASPTEETGLLVVDSVVPGGPVHSQLEPGDVLVCVNGEVVTQFLKLETLLDDSVDNRIELQIERGGASRTVNLVVQDLHSITPDYFLEVSGAVIHPLSYQQARNFRFPCGLAYVAKPGDMLHRAGVPRHAIIKKFAGEEIVKLEEFISVLSKLSRGARVPLEYVTYRDRHRMKCALVTIDHHEWYAPPQIYTRDDSSGLWTAKPAIIQAESLLPSSISSYGEPVLMEHMHQCDLQELTVAVTGTEITDEYIDEYGSKESHSRVEEYVSADGVVTPDSTLNESEDAEDSSTLESTASKDYQGATRSGKKNRDRPMNRSHQIGSCQFSYPFWVRSVFNFGNRFMSVLGRFSPKPTRPNPSPPRGATAVTTNASKAERVIEPSLVMFEVHVPSSCMIDGVHSQQNSGTGVIIHHSQNLGLVAVDKNTVEISASNVMLSFAAFPIEIPGEVVFLHPVHNFALVAYDPSALGVAAASVVRAAKLLPEPALRRGDSVRLIGLSRSLQATSRISTVTNPCAALSIRSAACPRYRAMNIEVIKIASSFGSSFSGVLTDKRGRVQALWGRFSTQLKSGSSSSKDHRYVRGIPVYYISQVLDKILSGGSGPSRLINGVKRPMPLVRILEVELYPTSLSKARSFGLSDAWIKAFVEKDPVRRQVLRVKGCLAGSNAQNLLEQGDMVLAVNKQPVTCFHDIEIACQAVDKCGDNDGKLDITIFRQGQEIDVRVGTDVRDGNGTAHVINWCGCIVQYPHPAVRALGFLPEEGHGVYVSRWCHGSPAHRYRLYALRWIVEVNGKQTPNLDAFVKATKEIKHGEFVRVRTVQLNGKPQVLTLKQDLHYWPTWELVFDPDTAMWRRRIINALDCSSV